MAGITGLGTTYNEPNFTGELFAVSNQTTKFLAAMGGLGNAGMTTSTEFEWEKYDLRAPAQRARLEGQDAPTAEGRVRANITNVVEIHQEQIAVSYTKLAAIGQKAGSNNAEPNPIRDEFAWQLQVELTQIARDLNWSLLNGQYVKPTDNTAARQTRGLRQAITTNVINKGTVVIAVGATATASTDKITATAHGLANGTRIYLRNVTAGGLNDVTTYYLVNTATNDFKLSLTLGGAAVDITADGTVDPYQVGTDVPTPDNINALLKLAFDGGGVTDETTATILVNSAQKMAISKAYASAYGKFVESSRTVGGVAVTELVTDFGTLNVMLEPMMPQHEIVVATLPVCRPVFLNIPNHGTLFVEALAKTGAQEKAQLYGECGLAYGSETAHAVLTGLAV